MKSVISFRLRKYLDSDLAEAIEKMDETELKDLCRDGLRLMLGIQTTKRIEVAERKLSIPTMSSEARPEIPVREFEQPDDPQRALSRTTGQLLLNNKKAPASNAGTSWKPPGR